MANHVTLYIVPVEEFDKHPEANALKEKVEVDFSEIIHEGYTQFWSSPRTWFFEDFLGKKLKWGTAYLFTKQELLNMLPEARLYVKPEVINEETDEFEPDTVAYVLKSYDELEAALNTFNEDTHVLVGYNV